MRDRFEELVSAYLDGELSSDERAFVEQQLAQSDEYRQLYQQLQRQHEQLQSLPRHRLSADFSDKLVKRLEALKATQPAPATGAAGRKTSRPSGGRRFTWNVVLGIASTIAAGLLIAMVLRDRPHPVIEPTHEARLVAFQKQFQLILVYDIAITPKGQKNGIFEQWLKAANIQIDRTVQIDDKLEKGVLDSRFIGDDKVVAGGLAKGESKADVEMILVRSTAGQIDKINREWLDVQGREQDEVHLRLDLATTNKELEIFLRLNDAVDGEGVLRQVSSETWTKPGAYRLKFRLALNSGSLTRLGAVSGPRVVTQLVPSETPSSSTSSVKLTADAQKTSSGIQDNANQSTKVSPPPQGAWGTDAETPSQVLIIIRHLKEDQTFPAVKGAGGLDN